MRRLMLRDHTSPAESRKCERHFHRDGIMIKSSHIKPYDRA